MSHRLASPRIGSLEHPLTCLLHRPARHYSAVDVSQPASSRLSMFGILHPVNSAEPPSDDAYCGDRRLHRLPNDATAVVEWSTQQTPSSGVERAFRDYVSVSDALRDSHVVCRDA